MKCCKPVRCVCVHVNHSHGPGGCSGETLRGAVWHPCKCETFREGPQEIKGKIMYTAIYGEHQGCSSRASSVKG